MIKKIISVFLTIIILSTVTNGIFAKEVKKDKFVDEYLTKVEDKIKEDLKDFKYSKKVNEVKTSELYTNLPKGIKLKTNKEMYNLCTEIEKYKQNNPNKSAMEIVKNIYLKTGNFKKLRKKVYEKNNNKKALNDWNKFSLFLSVNANSVYNQFMSLTLSEQILIASNPAAGYETNITKDLALQFTQQEMGQNGLGNPSDAYRHTIWNALMCRNISESWAQAYATAHEDKSQEELNQIASDGYYEYQHKEMDLHNNQQGRNCWGYWDSHLWVSYDDLKDRVQQKFDAGELTWLHQ